MEIKRHDPDQPVDLERFRLRTFIESLEGSDELEIYEKPIDLADIAAVLEGNPKAVLFRKAGPEGAELIGNVSGGRERIARAFGTDVPGLLPEVLRRLKTRPGVFELPASAAPVQQVVLQGEDADLTRLPVHLQHGLDGAPYISASTDIVFDERSGLHNTGMRRLMLRGPQETGVDLVSPSDLRAIYMGYQAQGKPLPVAFVVGSNPVDHVAAVMRMPVDELELFAALRGAPLPLVKCVTNDLMVPADAEMILEGYLDPAGHVEAEGPYGEFLGYYGDVKKNPLFRLTAITHRKDALFQTSTISGRTMGYTDTAQLSGFRTEVSVWQALETAVREPLGVHATTASGGMLNVRVSLRQRVPGEARNAIAAVFGSLANAKHVFVFDPDIDIFSDQQCDWALATRFQANRDLVVASGLRALPLDPSSGKDRLGAKAGFDCTMPPGQPVDDLIPEPPTWQGKRFDSIEAALTDGPKTFEALMVAVGSRDGREIVRTLHELRLAGRLGREEDGRWRLSE